MDAMSYFDQGSTISILKILYRNTFYNASLITIFLNMHHINAQSFEIIICNKFVRYI